MTTTRYGIITTVDSSAAVVVPPSSPLIGGIVGTAIAPVQGSNPNPPGTLPDVNTPIVVRSLAEAYSKGIGVGSILDALTRIFVQITARIIVIRTVDKTSAAASVAFFAIAEDHLGIKPNWIAAPGLTYDTLAPLPIITFTGGGGSGAVALAVLNAAGEVASTILVDGGTGYTTAPVIVITDPTGGAGATATAQVAGGAVTVIGITAGGGGYGTGTPVPQLNASDDVVNAMQTEAEHEGIHFILDIPPLSTADALIWLGNHTHTRGLQVANRGVQGANRYDGSAVAMGVAIRNETEREIFIELPSRTVLRVRTSPSNKVVRGITGADPEYVYMDRYQENPANVLRSAGAVVITYKDSQWKLWGSDTNTENPHEPLADVSVLRVIDQLTDDLDYELSFYEDEPMTPSLVESAVERAQATATIYANKGLMETGTSIIDDDATNYNTGDIDLVTEVQIAGVVHRIHNNIHLRPF